MKKVIFIVILFLSGYVRLVANDADLFNYDKAAIQTSLSDLSVLESYVTEHPALAIVHESPNGDLMINGMVLSSNSFQRGGGAMVPFPFFWGCVFGPIGLVIVMAGTNGDRRAEWIAMQGCITAVVFWTIVWFAYWGSPNYYGGYYH